MKFPVSVCDPYVVHTSESTQASSTNTSTIISKEIPYVSATEIGQAGHARKLDENQVEFVHLFILKNDLSLEECHLVNALPDDDRWAGPPQILNQRETSEFQVSIQDDFIVPNGVLDEEDQGMQFRSRYISGSEENTDVKESLSKDLAWSIDLEWFTEIKDFQETSSFIEALQRISAEILDRPNLFEFGMLTL